MFLVKYSSGNYDDYCVYTIFVTDNEKIAKKYTLKFNKILRKWKKYYSQLEEEKFKGFRWIKDEHQEQHFARWNSLRNVNECFYEKIPVR